MNLCHRNGNEHAKNLLGLAWDGHSYWKFTQSEPGRSAERDVFARYVEGRYTVAEDLEINYLSFVNESNIALCYMYGDTLTQICVNPLKRKFRSIMMLPITYSGSSLGEIRCRKLLVKKNYSLENPETIKLLIELTPEEKIHNLHTWLLPNYCFEERLRSFGYIKSAQLVHEITPLIQRPYISKQDLLTAISIMLVDNYI